MLFSLETDGKLPSFDTVDHCQTTAQFILDQQKSKHKRTYAWVIPVTRQVTVVNYRLEPDLRRINADRFPFVYVILYQEPRQWGILPSQVDPSLCFEWGYVSTYWLHHSLTSRHEGQLREHECVTELPSAPNQFQTYTALGCVTVSNARLPAKLIQEAVRLRLWILFFLRHDVLHLLPDQFHDVLHVQSRHALVLDAVGFYSVLFLAHLMKFNDREVNRLDFRLRWKKLEQQLMEYRLRTSLCRDGRAGGGVSEKSLRQLKQEKRAHLVHPLRQRGEKGPYFATQQWEVAAKAIEQRRCLLTGGAALFPSCFRMEPFLYQFEQGVRECQTWANTVFRTLEASEADLRWGKEATLFLQQFDPGFTLDADNPILRLRLSNPLESEPISLTELTRIGPPCVQLMVHRLRTGSVKNHLKFSQRSVAFPLLLQVGVPVVDIEDLVHRAAERCYLPQQRGQKKRSLLNELKTEVSGRKLKAKPFIPSCQRVIRERLCPFSCTDVCRQKLGLRELFRPDFYVTRTRGQ